MKEYNHTSQENFKLQTTSDEKYWNSNKRIHLATEKFKCNQSTYES